MVHDPSGSGVPPKFTRLNGEALWSSVLNRYELEQHELLILREIVRCVDDLDRLANIVGRQGAISVSGGVHPALAEARQMRLTLATLIGALRLPDGNEDDLESVRRPRRRPAVRSIDPPQPQPDRRAMVNGNQTSTQRQAPDAVVRRIDPPAPQGRHFADEPPLPTNRIPVTELLARVRATDPGSRR